ncbi:uncharacterized protein TNCV_614121 [Trichonephila clavipes]|nr:uncharacterized protein TNCV_614121 [Trichonephila clavipes]
MAQRKHLDDFLRGRTIGRLECGRTQLEVSEELGIAQSVLSRLWQRFQEDGNILCLEDMLQIDRMLGFCFLAIWTRKKRTTLFQLVADYLVASGIRLISREITELGTIYNQSNIIRRYSYRGDGIMVWAGVSLSLKGHTDLQVFHGETPFGVRYWGVIRDQCVRPYVAPLAINSF